MGIVIGSFGRSGLGGWVIKAWGKGGGRGRAGGRKRLVLSASEVALRVGAKSGLVGWGIRQGTIPAGRKGWGMGVWDLRSLAEKGHSSDLKVVLAAHF